MNPSRLLRAWLDGHRPTSQRETSAILDESRFLLASKLPTTADHVQNFTDTDLAEITAGGRTGTLERAHKVFLAKQRKESAPSTVKPVVPAPAPKAAPRSTPAPIAARSTPAAQASPHPHLDTLTNLSGDAASLYYREHKAAIMAEDMERKKALATTQLRQNCRAAKFGRGFNR
jgi:hypothetical protein